MTTFTSTASMRETHDILNLKLRFNLEHNHPSGIPHYAHMMLTGHQQGGEPDLMYTTVKPPLSLDACAGDSRSVGVYQG